MLFSKCFVAHFLERIASATNAPSCSFAGAGIRDTSVQHKWTQDVVEECKKSADSCVRTLGGRLRHIPKINDRDGTWAGEAERKARNTVPQGSAADIAKTAMVLLHKHIQEQLPGRCNILLMVCSTNPCCSSLEDPVDASLYDVLQHPLEASPRHSQALYSMTLFYCRACEKILRQQR